MSKGKLLLIGGSEDKGEYAHGSQKRKARGYKYLEILKELQAISPHDPIEIITTASRVPREVKRSYEDAFSRMHYPPPGFISIKNREDASEDQYLSRINRCGAVFFSGGDQFRLGTILEGTPVLELIKKRYLNDCDFLIAGTSAGAMAMGPIMIIRGKKEITLVKNTDLRTTAGFSILPNCIIDTHFMDRDRFTRLAHGIIMNPGHLGIGLGENTALLIKNGYEAECLGSGMVIIIDGKHIKHTNIAEAETGEPIFVEKMIVHFLVKGCDFSLKSRKFLKARRPFQK